ncbi:peptidoglycan amidohydrolase family protein [Candidatus Enterococcus mansonii]|uniref:NlpC/P60 domain-containing protein n=1 Tax=Candidatus Enterococcus mansonii TaxID=1834181 RepID=A0A242C5J2_9ENTE|nr:peptidoglycan amidohydrolase family protein [Enterococcus sp. 4G2_DIV0659]OTO05527.1 hypothetical protein A5880_002700 [Enterococcus sp. 4G2_DIV0659]
MAMSESVITWFSQRKGKVTYSMNARNGPSSYDCSSALFYALIAAGYLPTQTAIGNTDSLYRLEGTLLLPISRAQVQRGDIFVAGYKNGSAGAGGHTGVFVSPDRIIHCNYTSNGISETQASGRMGDASGLPVYFYRLKESTQANHKMISLKSAVSGYFTAEDALKNKQVKTTVKPGTYYIFNTVKNAVNVTSQEGTPGTWILAPTSDGSAKFNVGQTVNLVKKATHYQTGQKIPEWVKNKKYTVTQHKSVNQSLSKHAYLLKEIMSWVLEQDLS